MNGSPQSNVGAIAAGSARAILAALFFGVTTPLIQRFGRGLGPFTTAALLYLGAALAQAPSALRRGGHEAGVGRAHAVRIALVALFGALIAPVCLAWGLQRTRGTAASLLLNFEALFTVLLAWIFFRESLGRRVVVALIALAAGGALLALDGPRLSTVALSGSIAILAATLGWALDNTLTRPLADVSPAQVVFWKASIGAALGCGIAWLAAERRPGLGEAAALALCGATGYGLSLRLYLLAQRAIGAARTGSIFALAPFVGAACAWALGERAAGPWTLAAAALFALGIYLHLTERHRHRHRHEPLAHEHAHRHDDGHHDHHHATPVVGPHSHAHAHDAREHEHEHGPDAHHRHAHE